LTFLAFNKTASTNDGLPEISKMTISGFADNNNKKKMNADRPILDFIDM
jgi:hypothetical protein